MSDFIKITSTDIPEINGSFSSHEELYKFSIEKPEEFWGPIARARLRWDKEFTKVMDCNMEKGVFDWFIGGKLNASVQCVDRHCEVDPDRIALIWEQDEPGKEQRITFRQLKEMVCKIANVLKSEGVRKSDRVVMYISISPLAVASMLACARIGAVHSVIFAGFSAEALASRIMDAGASVVITSDQSIRGGRLIELKKTVDAAVAKCPSVRRVLVARRTGNPVPIIEGRDVWLEEAMEAQSVECIPESMDSEDSLFMLYTSGSTGKPKGLVHSTAGYLLYASFTHKQVFDIRDGDIFACVADIGWITGHSYVVYGPLVNGITTVLFESHPAYPDHGRYWEMVQRIRPTQFYGAPTAIRLLLGHDSSYVTKYDRSSLRTLGSVGEPINHEAWQWYHEVVGKGKCDVVDTWWQTETGGICISPRPSAPGAEIRSAMPMRPLFGIAPVILDDKGNVLEGRDVSGALCIRKSWPGIARTVYGDHSRYYDTYFKPYPGYYFTGDGSIRDLDGYYHITGRMDDVINVSGHRLGTAEVEDALDEHFSVAESAVVGYPHDIKGEGVYAYIVLKEGVIQEHKQIIAELRSIVRTKIAGHAVPEIMQICPSLPKTRSGKIMRRILRKIAADQIEELGDVTTLADPSIIEYIIKNHRHCITKNL
ncbi:acetyl-coenzyme A synthetase 2-like, mitochondrial isoform X2 [Artemia franciscana]|uniref:Acetyl-coenzyme A synthetase n=1 Tax=Artemia franciscana TaxID=6661 RepID=A0AA88HNH5_ARTSF|nr:hypothetical protein QYM36_015713 [Artemia franciscana]